MSVFEQSVEMPLEDGSVFHLNKFKTGAYVMRWPTSFRPLKFYEKGLPAVEMQVSSYNCALTGVARHFDLKRLPPADYVEMVSAEDESRGLSLEWARFRQGEVKAFGELVVLGEKVTPKQVHSLWLATGTTAMCALANELTSMLHGSTTLNQIDFAT